MEKTWYAGSGSVPDKEKQKPLLERYNVYIQSDLGMGEYGFEYGTLEEIYNPDDLTDNMDEVSLSQRLEKHRASGKSLIAKLAYEEGIITISPSSAYTTSVTENKEVSETTTKPELEFNSDGSRNPKYVDRDRGTLIPEY